MAQMFKSSFIYFLGFFLLTGCQQEKEQITPIDKEKAIQSDHLLIDLIRRVTIYDGSFDDIVDEANCMSVILPVTVVIDEDYSLLIETQDDYNTLKNQLLSLGLEPDDLSFIYPIQVVLSNYAQVTVTNEDQFSDLVDDCEDDGEDEDIECIDFTYPLIISVFNKVNETAKKITFHSDKDLHLFLLSLDGENLLTFDFPVYMVDYTGEQSVLNTISELETAITRNEDACDEKDDFDLQEGNVDPEFIKFLTEGEWLVEQYFSEEDLTSSVDDYPLVFKLDQTIYSNAETIGEWEVFNDESDIQLSFDFESSSPFDLLEDSWSVASYDDLRLVMYTRNSGSIDYLVLTRTVSTELGVVETALVSGDWYISKYMDSGNDETEDFMDFTITFDKTTLLAEDGSESIPGTWLSVADIFVKLDFDDAPLNELSNDWRVSSVMEGRIVLIENVGSDPDEIELTKR